MNRRFITMCFLALCLLGTTQPQDHLSWWVQRIANIDETSFLPELTVNPETILPDANHVIQKITTAQRIMDGRLADASQWLDGQKAASLTTTPDAIGDLTEYLLRFSAMAQETFVQTLITPVASEIFVMGDLHGSLQSFVRTLQRLNLSGYIDDAFNIIKPNFYMVVLGDFTDRGAYATEIIYLLCTLLIKNPEHMFILRGNHEDIDQQLSEARHGRQGFPTELARKYGITNNIFNSAGLLYSRLPVALYLGSGTTQETNFIQLSHAGIEPGFDPRPLFAFANHQIGSRYQAITCNDEANRERGIERSALSQLNNASNRISCGFTWSDFSNRAQDTGVNPDRGYFIKTEDASNWMDQHGDHENRNQWFGIIRGHQHNAIPLAAFANNFSGCNVHTKAGMWPCTDKHIDVSGKTEIKLSTYPVYTLLSAPGILPPENAFDSFAIITTAQQPAEWTIRLAQFRPGEQPQAFVQPDAKHVATAVAGVQPPLPSVAEQPVPALGSDVAATPALITPPAPIESAPALEPVLRPAELPRIPEAERIPSEPKAPTLAPEITPPAPAEPASTITQPTPAKPSPAQAPIPQQTEVLSPTQEAIPPVVTTSTTTPMPNIKPSPSPVKIKKIKTVTNLQELQALNKKLNGIDRKAKLIAQQITTISQTLKNKKANKKQKQLARMALNEHENALQSLKTEKKRIQNKISKIKRALATKQGRPTTKQQKLIALNKSLSVIANKSTLIHKQIKQANKTLTSKMVSKKQKQIAALTLTKHKRTLKSLETEKKQIQNQILKLKKRHT